MIIPELFLGFSTEPNEGFPKRKLLKGLFFSFGWSNYSDENEWARRLNYPRVGITLGINDYGNKNKIGKSYSFLPFAEFKLLKHWNLNSGIGVSYFDTKYDVLTNPLNKAITTNLNWSFRIFMYYDLFSNDYLDWKLGLGYLHSSNGHTRLPSQGLNSFLTSISTTINIKSKIDINSNVIKTPLKSKSSHTYFSARFGLGQNVLSEVFNDIKPVYTLAFSAGKVINKTFKFGGGFYFRFYQHYYDYIKNEEALIEEYPLFIDNPFGYASNFGLFATVELLLGHIGFEFDLGLNIHKPFYPIVWKLNEGYDYVNSQGDTIVVLGELDWYYEIKRTVSSRLGLKYYVINNNKSPKHNLFLGAHINGNLGQADFTDFSLGYVINLSFF